MLMDVEHRDQLVTGWYSGQNPVLQIAAELCIRVSAGEIGKGEALPTASDLAEEFETQEMAAVLAIKHTAKPEIGLVREKARGCYVAAIDVTGTERPPDRLPIAWSRGATPVSLIKGDLADQVLTGKVRGGERISPGTVAGQWRCSEREAQIAMRLLCQWPGLMRQDVNGFTAVA